MNEKDNANENANPPDSGPDRELGEIIAGAGAPEHGVSFWSDTMDALPGAPDADSSNDPDRDRERDVLDTKVEAEVISIDAAEPSSRRRRLAWIAGGSVGAVAAAAIAIASIGSSPAETTIEGPAAPSTSDSETPEVVPIEGDAVWEDLAVGYSAGVNGDSVLVFEPNPEATLRDCQGIGPARRLVRYGTDGSVEELVEEHTGSTLIFGRHGGEEIVGATSCEGTPGTLFAEVGGIDVLREVFAGELTELGLGVVHDAAWIDDQTIELVIDTTSELGFEPTLRFFRLHWDGMSSELEASDFESFDAHGDMFVEATDAGLAFGDRDGVAMPGERWVATPDASSLAVSFDRVVVAYVEGDAGFRLVVEGVATDVLDPEATRMVGFADDSRHLFYEATVGDERVVRMMTVNVPALIAAQPTTTTATTPVVVTINREDVEANEGQCHTDGVDILASTVEGPAAELAKQIGYAAATCDMDALVELAGELEGGITVGGDHFVDFLWAVNGQDPGPLQVLAAFMQLPPDRLENGDWIFPHQIVDATGSISPRDEQMLLSAGFGQEEIAEIASAGQYLGYHVTISEDGRDWVAFFTMDESG